MISSYSKAYGEGKFARGHYGVKENVGTRRSSKSKIRAWINLRAGLARRVKRPNLVDRERGTGETWR
jgi:hypothetical protein